MNAPARRSVLAIDPGSPGAAVRLNAAGQLAEAIAWRACRQGYRVSGYTPTFADPSWGVVVPGRPAALGEILAPRITSSTLLACEELFLSRQHRNAQTLITLARFTGAIMAAAEQRTGKQAAYVLASEWRHSVLGLRRNTRREQAKAASLRLIPPQIPGLAEALLVLGNLDHVTDAAGIALWRQRQGVSA